MSNASPATPELAYRKLIKHCHCSDCGDILAPGEWAGIIGNSLYCDGCVEAIQDAAEFDAANWAEMRDCGYI